MTPSQRLILRVLMEEYRRDKTLHGGLGPWGRTSDRVGVPASEVAMIEEAVVGYPDRDEREEHFMHGDISEYLAGRIEAAL